MSVRSSPNRCIVRWGRTVAAAALLAGISACGAAAPPQTQTASSTAYLEVERASALFAEMPASMDLAVAAITGMRKAPPSDLVTALRRSAERAFSKELDALRDTPAFNQVAPAGDADLTRSMAALTKAQDAVVKGGPGTEAGSREIQRKLEARPDRATIERLAGLMAEPRLFEEQALTAQRMKWILDEIRDGVPPELAAEMAIGVPAFIARSRRTGRDAQATTTSLEIAHGGGRALLEKAMIQLPPGDVATLVKWYDSAAGKAATTTLIATFQAANDRAGQAMLLEFLEQIKKMNFPAV